MKVMTFYHNFNILFTPLATNDGLLRHENLTFCEPGHLGGYLGALRPMLLCLTLCPLINFVQKQ